MAKALPESARIVLMTAALAVLDPDPAQAICAAAAGALEVSGAGLLLVSAQLEMNSVGVSNALAAAVEDVQYTLGEGPGIDAHRTKVPVLAPDLGAREAIRWPGFREGAQGVGVHAAFGFPLLIESVCFGALNLYNDRPGALTDEQIANAIAVSFVVSRTVLGWQTTATTGSLAWQLAQMPAHRAVIHQAAGMVSVQAAVTVSAATTLLRAYAFAEDRPIAAVAEDVVSHVLRFEA
jgi:hypothetical protein